MYTEEDYEPFASYPKVVKELESRRKRLHVTRERNSLPPRPKPGQSDEQRLREVYVDPTLDKLQPSSA